MEVLHNKAHPVVNPTILLPESAKAKGTHVLTICDARSDKATLLSQQCERVRLNRAQALFFIQRDLAPLQLRLLEINAILTSAGLHGAKIPSLEVEQAQIMEQLRAVGESEQKTLKNFQEEYLYYVGELHKKFKKKEVVIENVTTTVGRGVFAQRLASTNTYTGNVNYTALGTDNTAAVVGDATLGTETYRKAISSGTYSNNIAYLETFFTAAEVNGTFEEYGNFIDGTGSADTGQLFNRFLSSITKSALETLNVQSIITINDA